MLNDATARAMAEMSSPAALDAGKGSSIMDHHSHNSDFMKKILRQSVRRYLKGKSDIRKEDSEIK